MLSELLCKICWEVDFFSSYYFSFLLSFILYLKMSWIDDEKIVYLKLQETVNYHSWKQNMILLFKRKWAYEIALELKSKPVELAFLMKLMKLQYKDKLTAAHAISFTDSITVILQNKESTVAEASASSSLAILILFQDNIENDYQFYNQEWKFHDKWVKLNCKMYDIMWQHTEESCQSFLDDRTSFKAWSAIENLYWVIMLVFIIKVYSKVHD